MKNARTTPQAPGFGCRRTVSSTGEVSAGTGVLHGPRSSRVSSRLAPGCPTRSNWAEAFGVSHTIREALGGLVGQGLIVKTRGLTGGSYVAEPSIDQLSETLQVRPARPRSVEAHLGRGVRRVPR